MANPNPNPPVQGQPKPQAPPAKPEPKGTMVTYVPREGDPASVVWRGVTFHANKPVAVKHDEHLDQCKSNPWFNVEGHDPSAAPVGDDLVVPTDSEGYRRYSVAWFKKAQSSKDMQARWESEEGLRVKCGVGTDDLEYLNKLYVPRLAELKKAEG